MRPLDWDAPSSALAGPELGWWPLTHGLGGEKARNGPPTHPFRGRKGGPEKPRHLGGFASSSQGTEGTGWVCLQFGEGVAADFGNLELKDGTERQTVWREAGSGRLRTTMEEWTVHGCPVLGVDIYARLWHMRKRS